MNKFDLDLGILNSIPAKQPYDLGETNIVDYSEFDNKRHTASNEQIAVSSEGLSPEMEDRARTAATLLDCSEGMCRPRPRMLIWTKKVCPETKVTDWTFYLCNLFLTFRIINDFVNKMLLPKAGDNVHIYLPAQLYIDDAEVIASAMSNCASKNICVSAPYILDSGAAYLMCFAKHIHYSPAYVAHIDMSCVGGGGKLTDAANSINSSVYRAQHILNTLHNNGFLNDEQMKHITDNQGEIVLFGEEYKRIIDEFNARHSTK